MEKDVPNHQLGLFIDMALFYNDNGHNGWYFLIIQNLTRGYNNPHEQKQHAMKIRVPIRFDTHGSLEILSEKGDEWILRAYHWLIRNHIS